MKRISLAILLILTLPSCHHLMSQSVKIDPNLHNARSYEGQKKSVTLDVKDKRSNQTLIGKRWQVFGGSINSYQSVSSSIKKELSDALKKSGFPSGSDRDVELSIVVLEYGTQMDIFSMKYYSSFSINVLVKDKNDIIKYHDTLSDKIEEHSFFGFPFAETNEDIINQVISKVLNRLLESRGFLKSLND